MIKNILFDIDGTLLDTKDIFYESLNKTLNNFGYKETSDNSLFGMSVDQALNALGVDTTKGIKDFWEKCFNDLSMKKEFYAGIPLMMKNLFDNNITVVLVTSRSHNSTDPICEQSIISCYIKGCVAAEDTLLHKPDPAPIMQAMKEFGMLANETIYIGDTYQDYLAATYANVSFGLAGWNAEAQMIDDCKVFYRPQEIEDYIGDYYHE